MSLREQFTDQLKTSMKTLAKVWATVGKKNSPIAAAQATARFGARYANALDTYTTAITTCATQSLTATTTTTEDISSSDNSSSTDDTTATEDTTPSSDSSE